VSFKAVGEGRAISSLTNADLRFRQGLAIAADRAGRSLVAHAKQGMLSSGVPSAPGEHPGVRTGTLLSTVDYEVSGARFLRFGQGPADNNGFDYAIATHEGTKKMAPRPGLTNTVNALDGELKSTLGEVTFRYIVGGG
jgi:hypothetical protein